jgi:hypothetical protein
MKSFILIMILGIFLFSTLQLSLAEEKDTEEPKKSNVTQQGDRSRSSSVLNGLIPRRPRLGIHIGEPLGPVFGYYITKNFDFQTGLGYAFNEGFLAFFDFDFHLFPSDNPKGNLNSISPFFGIGIGMGFHSYRGGTQGDVNIRLPIGCSYLIPGFPGYPFFHIVPEIVMTPDTGVSVSGGLGFGFIL